MFLGKYCPPSIVTKLRNEITNFRQHPDESLFEAWERYKLSIDRCPNHNMSESSNSITFSSDLEIIALKAEMAEINKNLMKVLQINQQVKAVAHNYKTCGGTYSYNDYPATIGQTQNVYAARAYNQGGNSYQPQGNCNLLSYHSNNYLRPPGFNQNQNQNNPNQNYQNQNRIQGNNHEIPQGNNQGRNQFLQGASHGQNPPPAYQALDYQAPGYQAPVHQALIPQPQAMNTDSSSGSETLPSNTITNSKEDLKGITTQSGNAYKGPTNPTTSPPPKVVERETEVTKDMVPPTNNGSTKDVQPLFGPTIKSLLTNKEKLFELARTSMNEYCSAVLLKKLAEKLGDPDKFLIPCDFPGMDECLALADLDASINLMLLSVWNKLSHTELSPTCMTLELADRLISRPVRIAKDVFIKVGTYSTNYDAMLVNRMDLIDVACEEYSQEVIGFSVIGNPTSSTKPIISNSSPTLTSFEDSDFLLEETDAFLAIDDEPISPKIDGSYYNLKGDILLLEEFLNDDPSSPPLPPQELNVVEPTNEKSSIDEPPVVKLKDLPPHLEYAFFEGDEKLPVIIVKDLKDEEKTGLINEVTQASSCLATF
nr:reverse transcriptase domain-containing protein [Tanacetum cinerariifolium]